MDITQENRDCFTIRGGQMYVRVFVYGIFLGQSLRENYDMTEVTGYDTVKDFVTVGDYIVEARHVPGYDYALTGKLVELPVSGMGRLDSLERGYERVVVQTTKGYKAFMYAERGTHESIRQTRGNQASHRASQAVELQADSN